MTTQELLAAYYDGLAKRAGWQSAVSETFLFMGTGSVPGEPVSSGKTGYARVLERFGQRFEAVRMKESHRGGFPRLRRRDLRFGLAEGAKDGLRHRRILGHRRRPTGFAHALLRHGAVQRVHEGLRLHGPSIPVSSLRVRLDCRLRLELRGLGRLGCRRCAGDRGGRGIGRDRRRREVARKPGDRRCRGGGRDRRGRPPGRFQRHGVPEHRRLLAHRDPAVARGRAVEEPLARGARSRRRPTPARPATERRCSISIPAIRRRST